MFGASSRDRDFFSGNNQIKAARMDNTHSSFNFGRALRRLRMRHFELLHLLSQEGTVRSAARQMALTQPAVSKLLQELEDCFGAVLFDRTSSGVVPTAAGQHLILQATQWIHQLERSGEDVARIRDGAGVTLRIGTFSVLPRVPRAIAALRARLPGVVVRVREAAMVAQLTALAEGELDCVVGALPPEALLSPVAESLIFEPIADDSLCVMASPLHPHADASTLDWATLRERSWVLPPKESLLRRAFIDAHLTSGLVPPEPAVEVLSPVSVAELLVHDSGLLGLMRLEQAEAEHASGRLRRLPLRPAVSLPPLALITHSESRASTALLKEFGEAVRLASVG